MRKIDARFDIITSMFLGGPEPNNVHKPHEQVPNGVRGRVAIRPPSVKGALRFWWRALRWKTWIKAAGNDEAEALTRLAEEEGRVLGAAYDSSSNAGQAAAQIMVTSKCKPINGGELGKRISSGHGYLLGQGLARPPKQGVTVCTRGAIDGAFTLRILLHRSLDDSQVTTLRNAVLLLGLLGGLGARARRGFGSLAIQSLRDADGAAVPLPENPAEYAETLRGLLHELPSDEPPFSAFSRYTRVDISATHKNAWFLLNHIGEAQIEFRSNGRRTGKERQNALRQRVAQMPFKGDHDSMLSLLPSLSPGQGPPLTHPRRVIFGLPHNYFFGSVNRKESWRGRKEARRRATVQISPVNDKDFGRRASPLLIHIHRFPTGDAVAVQTVMRARFLPPDEGIRIAAGVNSKDFPVACVPAWDVLDDYLDGFGSRTTVLPLVEGGENG